MKKGSFKPSGITCNSKSVRPGFIFVALKGERMDGKAFIKEAVRKGARLIVFEGDLPAAKDPAKTRFLRVTDSRKFLALACAEFYGQPSRKIKVIGITGTNGKTTVSYLIEAILKEAGRPCGVIGTVNYRYAGRVFAARNTTPGAQELEALLSHMRRRRIKYCAMEVSSHALEQGRVEAINFSAAIFTNLTRDHLDYHKTMENYFRAKAALFKGLGSRSFTVINNDDKYGRRLSKLISARALSYGIDNQADVRAREVESSISGSRFILDALGARERISSNLAGRHNVYNMLAACAWALGEGISLEVIKKALGKFSFVPGRLEMIPSAAGFRVLVDYAHTDDALFNVLSCLRPLVKGKIILVFGCGGQRDKGKRPRMGRVASKLADFVIITDDNPRSEDSASIIAQIKKGIRGANYRLIKRREEAIMAALRMARKEDLVLVAGKGHEGYQIIKEKVIPFDDRQVVRKCLSLLNS